MSTGINTLTDFFVSVGFNADELSARKAVTKHKDVETRLIKQAEEGKTKRLKVEEEEAAEKAKKRQLALKREEELQNKSLKGLQSYALKATGFAVKAFATIEASALGVVFAVDRAAKGFEKLNYVSRLSGSSASKLSAFGYASSQLGGSRDEAEAQLTDFGQRMKMYRSAYEARLKAMQIATRNKDGSARDNSEIAADIGTWMRKESGKGQFGYARALSWGKSFGFDGANAQAMMRPEFGGMVRQYGSDQKKIGANIDEAAKSGTAFEQSMQHLKEVLEQIGTKIESVLFVKLKPLLDQLAEWFTAHGKEIADIVGRLADDLVRLATSIGKDLADVQWDKVLGNVEEMGKKFDTLLNRLGGDGKTMGLVALIGLLAVNLGKVATAGMPPWLKLLLGISIGSDLGVPNEQKPGIIKRSDDAAGGLPSDLANSDMDEADSRTTRSRKGFGRRGFFQRDGRGDDVQVSDESIPVEGKALLNTIASGEAHGYNIINGGSTFSDYSHHPYAGLSTNRGGRAAGRYQFLPSTWASIQGKTGLKDFSPENQDKAAWYLARRDYKARTGRDLQTDLKDPSRRDAIGRVLRPTWTSLGGSFGGKYDRYLAQQQMPRKIPPMLKARPLPVGIPDPTRMQGGADGRPIVLGAQHTSTRGDTTINANQTFHVAGGDPSATASAVALTARRGQQDLLRNVQGALT